MEVIGISNINKKLGEVVNERRKARKLSTKELSTLLQISDGTLNNIENAKVDTFHLDVLNKLVKELAIPLDVIFPKTDFVINFSKHNTSIPIKLTDEKLYEIYLKHLEQYNSLFYLLCAGSSSNENLILLYETINNLYELIKSNSKNG
ncbi:Helix-turn-helix domain-containing protein [Clostridium cavendishii DSM 21758]|uniref:Helix-turn-helix domain-containing protein n=1 Tax=Clostridium cavendishii DSM 21758 TaxID=1121302 RepID=A0A1M6LRI4_9CLOT|nr:helix-turn-helix transcriptional regulator [Clostridium cavendishii]SHJ73712.1 Helix-turn-helix domain-containing protein [Clostridium cavendishii DSM 21758]